MKQNKTRSQIRQQNRLKAYEFMGSKCNLCGYNKCLDALQFHHIDPSKKRFNISKGFEFCWDYLKTELKKCILVCANCHKELHKFPEIEDLAKRKWQKMFRNKK
jgi:predicted HNH restriction endonuclease